MHVARNACVGRGSARGRCGRCWTSAVLTNIAELALARIVACTVRCPGVWPSTAAALWILCLQLLAPLAAPSVGAIRAHERITHCDVECLLLVALFEGSADSANQQDSTTDQGRLHCTEPMVSL